MTEPYRPVSIVDDDASVRARRAGSRAVISVCAGGAQGVVVLLERP